MSDRKLNNNKRIITFLFFVLIGGIIFNSTFFLHSHRTACGKVIVHAHPFNKSAEGEDSSSQHKHNKIDLQVISSLKYFVSIASSAEIPYNPVLETEFVDEQFVFLISESISLQTDRGPPFDSPFIIA
ncbi:MAG: hypothetical protein KOO66_09785 [Bacteroidales bacterium]|nr:hypothetical protein [Bacteroidales bacterium]